jgi:hypothetical protein
MASIKSENIVNVYEIDNGDGAGAKKIGNPYNSDEPKLKVRNHWNNSDLVLIEADGVTYTVAKIAMLKAMSNATNCLWR